ncbi:MAG: hypothetical protein Q9168_000023 [Polycauliona sp. 1 TL-2023]
MEKIKNMIHPGKSKDDEVMYGSGQSADPVHTGTGSPATTTSSAREPVGQGGTGSIQQGSTPLSSSRTPGTFVDDGGSAMSIKSGQQGNTQESKLAGIPPTHDPLDTNKALPREPTTGPTGAHTSSTTSGVGPHSSSMANKADPRVDSDLDGSRGLGGPDTAGMSGGVMSSTLPDRTVGNTGSTNDTGRSFPLRGAPSGTSGLGSGTGATSSSAHQGDLSRSALGSSSDTNTGVATGAATGVPLPRGYGEESWTHDHQKHGHEFSGDPCENEPPAAGAVHFAPGPHSLDTANRLDPHVGGGAAGGLEHATADSTPDIGDRHTGSGMLASGGLGTSGIESSRGMQQSSTTAGPHKSDLLNEADPRVDSDLSKQQGTPNTSGLGSSGTTSTTAPSVGREHHPGRDAGLVGAGAGLGGAVAYGAEKHASHNPTEGTSGAGYSNPYPPTSGTTGPTSSSGLSSTSREPTTAGLSSTTGPSSSTVPSSSSNPISSTRGTTGATGPGLTSTRAEPGNTTNPSATSGGPHYGREAGLAGAGAGVGAGAAYEANKHLGHSHNDTTGRSLDTSTTQQPLSGSSRPDYGRDAGLTGAAATAYQDPRHQPIVASGMSGQPAHDESSRIGESHTGRNAALGAGAGAAAVAGGEELSRKEMEREQKAAHKEELQEQKAAHKQEVKDEKHHQHELDKEEKKHDKAIAAEHAKDEKHHQHEVDKAKKEHEKALAKEESKHHKDELRKEESHEGEKEKKHHGLLGFLHRDKPDKELKEDELARKESLEHPSSGAAGAAGAAGTAGVAGAEPGMSEADKHLLAREHDRNRLHKDPPPGYADGKYGEEPKSGYASQVTGGTGTTALAQGDPVPGGSHATGLGNKADPAVSGRGDTIDSNRTRDNEGRVVEPSTGLPMDLSKGNGAGGTDATPVHGYHPTGTTGTTGDSSTGGGFGHLQDHSR